MVYEIRTRNSLMLGDVTFDCSIHPSACLCFYSLSHNDMMMMIMMMMKVAAGLVGYSSPASLQVILRVFPVSSDYAG